MKTRITIAAVMMLLSAGLWAQQPQEGRPEPPKMKTPEEMAKAKADMMQAEVGLDEKQYKKVYKLFKNDFQYRQDALTEKFGEGMPPQGGPGMGGPGGGPGGFGGGMPPQGGQGMGGPGGGGMPPQGMQPGQGPEGAPGMRPGGDVITEEYLEKQDKKLRKIITEEQYQKWTSKHPAEHLQLPDAFPEEEKR